MVDRSNNGLDRKRGRLLYVTETVLAGPSVLVLSRTASSVSALARVHIRGTFTGVVGNGADFIITRELSAVGRDSIVLIVGSNGVVRRNARRRLLTGSKFCGGLCGDRFTGRWARWLAAALRRAVFGGSRGVCGAESSTGGQ